MAGTGQPVDGARVTLNGAELRGSRSILTNDDGQFVFASLPAGTFSVRATLTGHISGTYGQKQPGKPGTSIVLADGQHVKDASFEIAKGGVISGSVFDEKGRPSIGTPVRVMRWVMQSGERVLTTTGNGTTDDRGIYRIFNLSPGDYLVSAVPRNTPAEVFTSNDMMMAEARMSELMSLGLASPASPISVSIDSNGRVVNTTGAASPSEPVQGYAPVFYPGTTQLTTAQTVRVGIAGEQLGVDFSLQRVALTSVNGQIVAPNGQNPTTIQIRLLQAESGALGLGQQTARPSQTGTFTFRNVVPGQYTIFATANVVEPRVPGAAPGATPSGITNQQPGAQRRIWAQADVFVDGAAPPVVSLTMQEGLPLSGHIMFDGTAPQPTGNQRVRVMLNPLGAALQSLGMGNLSTTVDAGGRFTINGVIPGRYRVSASGAQGWSVKSVMVNGVDVLDFPFVIAAGETAPDVTIQFGDRNTDLKGVLTDATGAPAADYSVVIFPGDQRYWVPFARRMRSTRPASDGKFAFVGLPPGEYRIAAVTDVETGEWLDPEFLRQLLPASIGVRLADGQQVTQDIRVR
jgi:protocatechuate 3,4-dioxygenase beta subunit